MKKTAFVLLGVVLAICAIVEAHTPEPGFVNGFGLSMVVDGKAGVSGVDATIVSDSNYSLKIKNQNHGFEAIVRITLDGVTVVEGLRLEDKDTEISIDRSIGGPAGFGNLFEHLDTKAGEIRAEFTYTILGKARVETITINIRK